MLNDELYKALEEAFQQPIHVASENSKATYDIPGKVVKGVKDVKGYAKDWGETYHLNCPVCGDRSGRLYFSHLWGTYIKANHKKVHFNKNLYVCHNERCNVWDYVKGIAEIFYDGGSTPKREKDMMQLPVESGLPVGCVPFKNAPIEAAQYLHARGFNIDHIVDNYRVSYVPAGALYQEATDEKPEMRFQEPRIIIPIICGGRLVSWQARALTNDVKRRYLFPPGSFKTRYLYGMDTAWEYDTVVIQEGVTDNWKYGLDSMCPWGKKISAEQIKILEVLFGTRGRCVVMLDSQEQDPTTDKASAGMVQALRDSKAFPWGIHELRLPKEDPGYFTSVYLRGLVEDLITREDIK